MAIRHVLKKLQSSPDFKSIGARIFNSFLFLFIFFPGNDAEHELGGSVRAHHREIHPLLSVRRGGGEAEEGQFGGQPLRGQSEDVRRVFRLRGGGAGGGGGAPPGGGRAYGVDAGEFTSAADDFICAADELTSAADEFTCAADELTSAADEFTCAADE